QVARHELDRVAREASGPAEVSNQRAHAGAVLDDQAFGEPGAEAAGGGGEESRRAAPTGARCPAPGGSASRPPMKPVAPVMRTFAFVSGEIMMLWRAPPRRWRPGAAIRTGRRASAAGGSTIR